MSGKISIAHVVELSVGGVGIFAQMLAKAQLQDPEIAEVHILADARYVGDLAAIPGLKIHYYESSRNFTRLVSVARSVRSILREIAPDIVIAHSSFPGQYVRLGWRRTRWKTIYCAHGWSFAQTASRLKRIAYGFAERILDGRTDAIVNVSEQERDDALRAGLDPRILRLVPNGLPDIVESSPASAIDRQRLNVGYIGRIDHKKGTDRLLAAFDDDRLSSIDLWLIGEPVGEAAPTIPDRSNIHLLGWLPHALIDSHIRAMDAIVVPSRWEGCPLIVIETMRAGRAIIANRLPCIAEMMTDGQEGRLVDIDDLEELRAILVALDKDGLRRMGQAARGTYDRKYTWARCYAKWKRIIVDLLARGAR